MRVASAVGLIVLVPGLASAKVRSLTLEELFRASESVVVGTVSDVVEENGHRYATIDVERVIKGQAWTPLRVLAESTFACDISDSVRAKERVILFVTPADGDVRYITHAGRGYFRTQENGTTELPEGAVRMPKTLENKAVKRDGRRVITTDVFIAYLEMLH